MIQFYVIDIENLGFKLGWHEVTEISIIRCSDLSQISRFIKPEYPGRASQQALDATGRTFKDLLKGEPKIKVVNEIHDWIVSDGTTDEGRCLIGHNCFFDFSHTKSLWEECDKAFPFKLIFDTKPFAKKWARDLGIEKPKLTLAASLENVGLKPISKGQHDAVSDSQNTYYLWKKGCDAGIDYLPLIKRYSSDE